MNSRVALGSGDMDMLEPPGDGQGDRRIFLNEALELLRVEDPDELTLLLSESGPSTVT